MHRFSEVMGRRSQQKPLAVIVVSEPITVSGHFATF